MDNTQFTFVRHFKVGNLDFDLYKNIDGNYFTTCLDTDTNLKTGMFYSSFDLFNKAFSGKLTGEELLGIGEITHQGTVGKPEALR
ncbi:MAG TPA: hypothetical protein VFG54_18065 [Prolixibacteraceae bacterium]|nr:hypothetical protein [Prolixibacteraceae bacterium]